MAKISQSLTFTVRLGDKDSTQHVKVGLDISEVDTEIPLAGQLGVTSEKIVLATAENLWKYVKKQVDKQLEEIFDEVGGKSK